MFQRIVTALFFLATGAVLGSGDASAQTRRALVIGIDEYRNVTKLERAVADAKAMSRTLEDLGFTAQYVENPDRNAMSVAIARFEESIERGDTAFVFYAGHGMEIAGQNMLLPADVPDPSNASSGILRDAAFSTATLIERITERGARSSLFVFDACRNNPYAQPGATRAIGSTRGLARAEPPEGVFVLMSAGQNQLALDSLNRPGREPDSDPNSVFTRVLLKELAKPGLTHIAIAKSVQARVRDMALSVSHVQVPAFYDQIIGDVTFRPADAAPPPVQPSQPELAALADPPVAPPSPPVVEAPARGRAAFDLGGSWQVVEYSASGLVFDGVWRRTGANTFDAKFRERGSGQTFGDTIVFDRVEGNTVVLSRPSLKGFYYGKLSADGRSMEGNASWYGPGDRWTGEIRPGDWGPAAQASTSSVAATPAFDLGKEWHVREYALGGRIYEGTWRRAGKNTFHAQWRDSKTGQNLTDTVYLDRVDGDTVYLNRPNVKGRYIGKLSADGRSISGRGTWYKAGERWTVQIR